MLAWPETALEPDALAALGQALARRLRGEPLAHVLGSGAFWTFELEVGPAVLVPRADTETLVERALLHLEADPHGLVLEAGTGTGAVAIALATECPNPIVAIELHADALAVARRNARRLLAPGRLGFVRGDWLAAFADASAALIVANPPYLADDDPHLPALAHEPRAALVSGPEGLDALTALIVQARRVARPGAVVALEHGCSQGAAVRGLLARHGFADVVTTRDLAGLERVSEGRAPPQS